MNTGRAGFTSEWAGRFGHPERIIGQPIGLSSSMFFASPGAGCLLWTLMMSDSALRKSFIRCELPQMLEVEEMMMNSFGLDSSSDLQIAPTGGAAHGCKNAHICVKL